MLPKAQGNISDTEHVICKNSDSILWKIRPFLDINYINFSNKFKF